MSEEAAAKRKKEKKSIFYIFFPRHGIFIAKVEEVYNISKQRRLRRRDSIEFIARGDSRDEETREKRVLLLPDNPLGFIPAHVPAKTSRDDTFFRHFLSLSLALFAPFFVRSFS